MKSLPLLICLTFFCACSAKKEQVQPETPPTAADTSGTGPAKLGTEPVLDQAGLPQNCPILYDGLCYQSYEDACSAASCPSDRCSILETYPGQVACRPAADAGA